MHAVTQWALDEVGGAELGDTRRTKRIVAMVAGAARVRGGRISEVFRVAADRQAAYDFLEHDAVDVDEVRGAMAQATARRCAGLPWVHVVLDGTSLTLTDREESKDFGSIGRRSTGARGLKVLNSLVLGPDGTPIGVPVQIWWRRGERVKTGYRPQNQRESAYWGQAVDESSKWLSEFAPATQLHFVADREADASALILQLLRSGHAFTIRSNATRKVQVDNQAKEIRPVLLRKAPKAVLHVDVPATSRRSARRAKLRIRAARMTVILSDHHIRLGRPVELNVVWAREEGTCPRNEKPLDWVVFTNVAIGTRTEVCRVIETYKRRWRIEDFHKTWKNGHCKVEESQLRSMNAVIKWATILAMVASRAERLKHRARENPQEAADVELSHDELEALLFLKQQEKRRTEVIPETGVPSLKEAVRWLADLGGYVGAKSSGHPGATTIGRGLQRVITTAEVLVALRAAGKLR